MGGYHLALVGDRQGLQHLGGVLHCLPIRLRTHDDADQWRTHAAHGTGVGRDSSGGPKVEPWSSTAATTGSERGGWMVSGHCRRKQGLSPEF